MAPPPLPLAATAAAAVAAVPLTDAPPAAAFFRRPVDLSARLSTSCGARPSPGPGNSYPSRRRNSRLQYSSRRSKGATGRIYCSQVTVDDGVDDETCELVSGVDLVIGDGEDSIRAYLLKAVKNNNGTGVLLLSDVFGFEDSSTREFAYRVACNGYNVLVPDLFRGNPCKKGQSEAEFGYWLARQSHERVACDIATSSKWMVDEFIAAGISKKLGIIGFCFGGHHLVKTLARDEHAYFGTGICFYGTNLDPSLAPNIRVPVLFVCGDDDPLCPIPMVNVMEKSMRDSKTLIYQGRGHEFAHRPESQEEDDDAEDAFVHMRNWLHDSLISS